MLDIVRRAQGRDHEAFELLVEEHAPEMYRIAAAIVGAADAWDLTQETFVVGWEQLPRLRDVRAFRSWIRRICVNRSRNWLRHSHRQAGLASLEDEEGRAAERLHASRGFEAAAEARIVLEDAFLRLPPDQRAVLALHYSMGLSIAETAEAIGVRVGTAKSRLSAGLSSLRTSLATEGVAPSPETVT